MFVCLRCTKDFKNKFNLKRHLKYRVSPCDEKRNDGQKRGPEKKRETKELEEKEKDLEKKNKNFQFL